jgi:hypothetical protein
MRKTLAVAAREIQERWLLLAGGLALGFVPLVIPHLDGRLNRDAVAPVGLVMAILIGGFAAILAGGTMFVRDAEDGRLAFLLGKPVSWPSIWAGKWAAAALLAGASGLLASIPWMVVFPPETKTSWWSAMANAQGWVFAVSTVVLIIGLANFAMSALRARSAWLVLDLAFLLVAVWAFHRFVVPLVTFGVIDLRGGWSYSLIRTPLALALALLIASAGQLALGRTDPRRAHRALSIGVWAIVFSLLVAAAAWFAWVERATPADLRMPYLVRTAPDGRWVYFEGRANRGGLYSAHFLIDSASGRHLRTLDLRSAPGWWDSSTGFSADGRFAVKWKASSASTALAIVDLGDPQLRPVEVTLEGSAPPTFWTTVSLSIGARTALVVQASTASLVALPSGRALAVSSFAPGRHVAAARLLSETQARLWLSRFDPGVAPPANGPGELQVVDLTAGASPRTATVSTAASLSGLRGEIVPDEDGERLLTLEREHGLVLRRGADGAPLATLLKDAKVDAARFLADNRVAAVSGGGSRIVLRTFAADGTPVKRSDLDPRSWWPGVSLGPEVRPGQVVIATGAPLTFPRADSLVVDVAEGRVVERLVGLRPAPTRLVAGDVQARPASQTVFPPSYFVSGSGQVVRIDFATGERRIVAGPGAPRGERLQGF